MGAGNMAGLVLVEQTHIEQVKQRALFLSRVQVLRGDAGNVVFCGNVLGELLAR